MDVGYEVVGFDVVLAVLAGEGARRVARMVTEVALSAGVAHCEYAGGGEVAGL